MECANDHDHDPKKRHALAHPAADALRLVPTQHDSYRKLHVPAQHTDPIDQCDGEPHALLGNAIQLEHSKGEPRAERAQETGRDPLDEPASAPYGVSGSSGPARLAELASSSGPSSAFTAHSEVSCA